jgi:diamine N-acetyltransferase
LNIMEALVLRPAGAADADRLSALLCAVFAHTYGAELPDAVLDCHLADALSPAALAAALGAGGAHAILAEFDGATAGCAMLAPGTTLDSSATLELAKLYVLPAHQGRGVAGALLDAALIQARALGHTRLWLCVWERNPRAIAFYRKHGFVTVGRARVQVGPVVFEDFVMERVLS